MVFDFTKSTHVTVDQIRIVGETISSTRRSIQEYNTIALNTAHHSFTERLRKISSAHPKTPAAPYLH